MSRPVTARVPPRAILFDLDGTLADTAPDLSRAVNRLRTARRMAPVPYSQLRPFASAGARGLIGVAFGINPADATYALLRDEFLANYEAEIASETCLFDGIDFLLNSLVAQGIVWGIVTNKSSRLTSLLIPKIGLGQAACVVCGDTTPHAKPHPAPLLEAARRLKFSPSECWYVGDDLRDIDAGKAAGMHTVAAAWGYCGVTEPASWNADDIATTPQTIFSSVQSVIKNSVPE